MGIGRIKLARFLPFRAVLALAFVVLSTLQPGLFVNANATGFHADNGITPSAQSHDHDAAAHDHHAAEAGHGDHAKAGADEKADHNGSNVKDASCEVHCAPLQGIPADCSSVFSPSVGCAPETTLPVLLPGEPAELKRPPRA